MDYQQGHVKEDQMWSKGSGGGALGSSLILAMALLDGVAIPLYPECTLAHRALEAYRQSRRPSHDQQVQLRKCAEHLQRHGGAPGSIYREMLRKTATQLFNMDWKPGGGSEAIVNYFKEKGLRIISVVILAVHIAGQKFAPNVQQLEKGNAYLDELKRQFHEAQQEEQHNDFQVMRLQCNMRILTHPDPGFDQEEEASEQQSNDFKPVPRHYVLQLFTHALYILQHLPQSPGVAGRFRGPPPRAWLACAGAPPSLSRGPRSRDSPRQKGGTERARREGMRGCYTPPVARPMQGGGMGHAGPVAHPGP